MLGGSSSDSTSSRTDTPRSATPPVTGTSLTSFPSARPCCSGMRTPSRAGSQVASDSRKLTQ
eukprot:2687889-Heterocapsa_arctica.AAC.1